MISSMSSTLGSDTVSFDGSEPMDSAASPSARTDDTRRAAGARRAAERTGAWGARARGREALWASDMVAEDCAVRSSRT